MTTADRFSGSDLDYMTWANKMVAEGKMYWPNNPSTLEIRASQATFSLTNIACGFIGASQPTYQEGEAKFCDLVKKYASLNLLAAEYFLQDLVCQGHEECSFLLDMSLEVAGGFAQDAIPSICAPIFEELYNNCHGAVGGSAQVTVSDSHGTQTGSVQAQFYANDPGATCPANTATNVCGSSLGN